MTRQTLTPEEKAARAAEKAAKAAEKDAADKAAAEKVAREAAEKAAAAEEAAREAAERAAAEDAAREAAEKEAAEKVAREMAEKAAAEREAASKAATEAAKKKVAEEIPLSPATAFANSQEELAARRAAPENPAQEPKAEVDPALEKQGLEILAAYPDATEVYMTSNGFGFFRETDARNHAATLRNKTVTTVKRK